MHGIWIVIVVAALVLLIVYWRGRNAVWGGATMGVIAGVLWKLIGRTPWSIVLKVAAIGALSGFVAELLGRLSRRQRESPSSVPEELRYPGAVPVQREKRTPAEGFESAIAHTFVTPDLPPSVVRHYMNILTGWHVLLCTLDADPAIARLDSGDGLQSLIVSASRANDRSTVMMLVINTK